MSFWKKLWEAVFLWKVPNAKDIRDVDAILVFAAGEHKHKYPGPANDNLAQTVIYLQQFFDGTRASHVPVLAQAEAWASTKLKPFETIQATAFQRDLPKKDYLDTFKVAETMLPVCEERGWKVVAVVAPKYAMWRTWMAMIAAGFKAENIRICAVPQDVFFNDCAQWGGRWRILAYLREFAGRVGWTIIGKI